MTDSSAPALNPVVLVHGIKDDSRKMEPLARHLRAEGREAHALTYRPSWGQTGIDQLARQLGEEIDRRFAPGRPLDFVGFSMGGLVCRYYLQRLGGLERAGSLVTIATPHRGSWLAWLLPNAGGRQLRPGSPFLRDLAQDAARLKAIRFTSLWTPMDAMIVPAASSVIPEARCRKLWCLAHPLMVLEPRCIRAAARALED
jgi:triacylglycerol lipase